MIRIIVAALLIIASLFGLLTGVHPVWAVVYMLVALFLISWVCVNKFEDQPQLG